MKKISLFILFYFILRLVSSCSNDKKEAMQDKDTAIVERENIKDDNMRVKMIRMMIQATLSHHSN